MQSKNPSGRINSNTTRVPPWACIAWAAVFCALPALTACAPSRPAPAPPTVPAYTETPAPTPAPTPDWWHPAPGLTWQWHLGDVEHVGIDLSVEADVFDIDLDTGESIVEALHGRGRRVICYISVGSYERWRRDADQFPAEVLGKDYEGWPGERWLDVRRIDLLAPVMRARLDRCQIRGFDAVEPDNMDVYTNDTGFPLTYDDQLRYALWLADEAHQRGLAIGVKNAPDQASDLVEHFDFAIIEDAFYYRWAEDLRPFIEAGKPVFAAEYTDLPGDFAAACERSRQLGYSTILKNRELDAWLQACP